MAEHVEHCPFLNRADGRCGEHFGLESLDHAFRYCFDRYKACPVYLELLLERRVKRVAEASLRPAGGVGVLVGRKGNDGGDQIIPLTIARRRFDVTDRHPQRGSDRAGVSAALGV